MIDTICQALLENNRWKYVHVKVVWQLTPSLRHYDTLISESMYMWMTINAICQALLNHNRWKYVQVEVAGRL